MINDICTTIFWQFFDNFLSCGHIMFLFSLFIFLSLLFLTSKKRETKILSPKLSKIVVQISLLWNINQFTSNSLLTKINFKESIYSRPILENQCNQNQFLSTKTKDTHDKLWVCLVSLLKGAKIDYANYKNHFLISIKM